MGKSAEMGRRGRLAMKVKEKPPKPRKLRKRSRPPIPKTLFLAALKGTYGNKSRIARRLDVSWETVDRCLRREGWEDVLKAFELERHRMVDDSEGTMMDVVNQRLDVGQARQAAQFVLERQGKDRGWHPKSTVQLEGGDRPIDVRSVGVQIPIDFLNLSVEERRKLLEEFTGGNAVDQTPP